MQSKAIECRLALDFSEASLGDDCSLAGYCRAVRAIVEQRTGAVTGCSAPFCDPVRQARTRRQSEEIINLSAT